MQHAVLRREFSDGNITRFPDSHYLDLVVDERSVSEVPLGGHSDMVTSLNRAGCRLCRRPFRSSRDVTIQAVAGAQGFPVMASRSPARTGAPFLRMVEM